MEDWFIRSGLYSGSYASLDTLQVKDYSRFAMGAFDEEAKKKHHDEQFPVDLQECFKLGADSVVRKTTWREYM